MLTTLIRPDEKPNALTERASLDFWSVHMDLSIMASDPYTTEQLASPLFLVATTAAEGRRVVVYFAGLKTLLLQYANHRWLHSFTLLILRTTITWST